MARFIDPFYFNSFIDTNILDGITDVEDAAVLEIARLADEGQLTVLLPYSVRNEAKSPNAPVHVRRAADMFVFSIEVELTESEKKLYRDLVVAAKGNAQEKNIAADLFHVCEAAKYGGYFITRDIRLLKRREVIAKLLQVDVVTPDEFLHRVAQARERAKAQKERRRLPI